MTLLASLDGFMLVRVALTAGKSRMFGVADAEHFPGLAVTKGTDDIGDAVWICNFQRLMRRMTGNALVKVVYTYLHPTRGGSCSRMLLVAFQAIGNGAMFSMVAGRAV